MNLADKSYLITGASGFLGSHLGNRLKALGADVRGIDSLIHPSTNPLTFQYETGDVRWDDLMMMRMKDADMVIHLAALINVDFSAHMPERVWDTNVDGTMNILETARKLDKPVIYASSSEVYGTAQTRAMNESHPLDGQSPYAASKIAADRMCKAWSDAYGMDIRVLRLFNTFGPYQSGDGYGGVIAKFTKQALAGKPMQIYGSGEQRRDYLYIDDAVDAYILALSSRQWPGPMNFSTGTTVSINELAVNIQNIIAWDGNRGVDKFVHVSQRVGEVDCLRGDWSRAKELGWSPKTAFAEGLRKYIDWAKS